MKAFDISQQVRIMFWKLLLELNSTGTDLFCPDLNRISVWNPNPDGIGRAPSDSNRVIKDENVYHYQDLKYYHTQLVENSTKEL